MRSERQTALITPDCASFQLITVPAKSEEMYELYVGTQQVVHAANMDCPPS